MFGAIKTLGTVLTVVSTAQFGKELYANYKNKKRKRQLDEVHDFISHLDLEALQNAIKTNNTDTLIDAVENIIQAAENVRIKSDLEDLKDDVSNAANKVFNKVSGMANKVADKINGLKPNVFKVDDEINIPSFDQFMAGMPLYLEMNDTPYLISVNDVSVSVNPKLKMVIILFNEGETIKKITLK